MVWFIALFLVILIFLIAYLYYVAGLKQGQVDALNGIQRYVLIEFEDGTRQYRSKSELKSLKPHKIIQNI